MEWRKTMMAKQGVALRGSVLSVLIASALWIAPATAQTVPAEPAPSAAPAAPETPAAPEAPPAGLTPPTGSADQPASPAAPDAAAPAGAPGETPAAAPMLPPLTPLLDLSTPEGNPVLGPDARQVRVPAMTDPNGFPVFGPDGLMVPMPVQYDAQGNVVIDPNTQQAALLSGAQMPRVAVVDAVTGQPVTNPAGQPLFAPALIGRDGKPVTDAAGNMVALAIARDATGAPVLTPDGQAIVLAPPIPDKLPLLGPDGQPIFNAGQPLMVPVERDADGRPVLGADGKPRRSAIKTDTEGRPVLGADGQPVLAGEEEAKKHDLTPIGMFLMADIVVKTVMILLILMSIVTWAYLFAKLGYLSSLDSSTKRFIEMFRNSRSLSEAAQKLGKRDNHPAARMMVAAVQEIEETRKGGKLSSGEKREHLTQRIAAAMGVAQNSAATELGQGMSLFAIVASNAPFIGLFGTVWGIMNSFIGIAETNTTNLAVVAPGIAEALFATGMGLFAAIPAAIFYNIFARRITQYNTLLENFSGELLVRVSRQLDMEA